LEPNSFKKALTKKDAPLWQLAINEELNFLEKNKTWEYVPLLPTRQTRKLMDIQNQDQY
jgi:hypothetical protein